MVEINEVLETVKKNLTFINSIEFGEYNGKDCICTISFKSLCVEKKPWNAHLIDCLNNFIVAYDAVLYLQSTLKNLVIVFKVKL